MKKGHLSKRLWFFQIFMAGSRCFDIHVRHRHLPAKYATIMSLAARDSQNWKRFKLGLQNWHKAPKCFEYFELLEFLGWLCGLFPHQSSWMLRWMLHRSMRALLPCLDSAWTCIPVQMWFCKSRGGQSASSYDGIKRRDMQLRNDTNTNMGISWNGGLPKSPVLMGFSPTSHPFYGTPAMETSISTWSRPFGGIDPNISTGHWGFIRSARRGEWPLSQAEIWVDMSLQGRILEVEWQLFRVKHKTNRIKPTDCNALNSSILMIFPDTIGCKYIDDVVCIYTQQYIWILQLAIMSPSSDTTDAMVPAKKKDGQTQSFWRPKKFSFHHVSPCFTYLKIYIFRESTIQTHRNPSRLCYSEIYSSVFLMINGVDEVTLRTNVMFPRGSSLLNLRRSLENIEVRAGGSPGELRLGCRLDPKGTWTLDFWIASCLATRENT